MKKYIIFIITIFCYITVLSQVLDTITYPKDMYLPSKPMLPIDTNVCYSDMRDYVLKVKIIEKCTCKYYKTIDFISLDKNLTISAITPAVFLKMDVIKKIQDFSSDSIPDSVIMAIKYLLVPNYLIETGEIPYNIPINIIVNRGINYDYLKFDCIVNDDVKFERKDPYFAGTRGLESKGEHFSYFLWFFMHKIISYNRLLKLMPKSNNSKNIERCLKQLKNK
jgi:hypothetical protein